MNITNGCGIPQEMGDYRSERNVPQTGDLTTCSSVVGIVLGIKHYKLFIIKIEIVRLKNISFCIGLFCYIFVLYFKASIENVVSAAFCVKQNFFYLL